MNSIESLEAALDSFDSASRSRALDSLCAKLAAGEIAPAPSKSFVNLHCHTFYSYNAYGYSPSKFAWLAKKTGLASAGIVDFDVLDGINEFLAASAKLSIKASAGMETRVFVPEFASRVINSPGEPGVAYHMGTGIPSGTISGTAAKFQKGLAETAQQRNRQLIDRVNKYLAPAVLDYNNDVLPLTPAGNATERHICLAYANKARQVFKSNSDLAAFWTEKLGVDALTLDLPAGPKTNNAIRAKTMKQGGIGYVQPDSGSFPNMADTNRFILDIGGIPTLTWLDGTSEGEQHIEELIDIAVSTGVAAINIIPDRNYKPGVSDAKLANLRQVIEISRARNFPIIVGTEMNSPGNKFVDSFETAELSPFVPEFLKGALIVYAHSSLQPRGLGYLGAWASKNFSSARDKNEFFEQVGRNLQPQKAASLKVDNSMTPREILAKVSQE